MFGNSRWRTRMDAHNRRMEALVARLDANVDSTPGPGDARWDAEMQRLTGEIDVLSAEGKTLFAEAQHIQRRVRVAAWLALAGMFFIGAAKVWATWVVAHR